MNKPSVIITLAILAVLAIYLFVTAPPPLPEAGSTPEAGLRIPVNELLAAVAAENDAVRALFTREVVGKGPAVGLRFDEFWRDESIEAGPLPALFLREAAASLQRSTVPLSLFLGSDFPISPSNRFTGLQATKFQEIKATREPRYFYAEDTGQYTAMFPDFSNVQPCVTCHNEHPNSPKTDWTLEDVMGATTWAYPRETVSVAEFMAVIAALRQGFRDAWNEYLTAAEAFAEPPKIGECWPAEGRCLPSVNVFMAEFERRASPVTMKRLLDLGEHYDPAGMAR